MHIVLQNPVTITRFYQPGLPNAVFCLKPALISHILLFPAYSLQCFLSKRLFPAKRALRPGMIFASPASRDELAGLASADNLRRIETSPMVPFFAGDRDPDQERCQDDVKGPIP